MTDTEIVIIGGGIAGASTAFHLAQHGRDVTLLERGEIASEASGVNAGGIGALGWGHAPDLEAHLTMGSLRIFRSLQLEHGYDIEFRASGGLQVIHTRQQYEYARDRAIALQARGYSVDLLSIDEARGIEPELNPDLPGGLRFPLRGQADPQKATRALAHAARQRGANILTGREVAQIRRRPDGAYEVLCGDETFTAGTLALAAGAWCAPLGEMLGLRIPIVPVRGQMWATRPLPPRVFHGMASVESYAHWSRSPGGDRTHPPELTHVNGRRTTRHLYGRQTRDGEVIFGGDREAVGYRSAPDAAGVEANFGHAAEALPFLAGESIARAWSGLMPFSLDGRPIIGKLPRLESAYIVSGLASSGFGRGPMAGRLLADYIHTGHRPQPLAECDPARCVTPIS